MKRLISSPCRLILVSILAFFSVCWSIGQTNQSSLAELSSEITENPGFPIYFEENRGQEIAEFHYVARGAGYTAGFASGRVVFSLGERVTDGTAQVARTFNLRFGNDEGFAPIGEIPEPFISNYLNTARPGARDAANIPNFRRIRYQEISPGIDLVFYRNAKNLEFDLIMQPGASLHPLDLTISGADRLELDSEGNLVIIAGGRQVVQRAPYAFQETNSGRRKVECDYRLTGENRVRIELGEYDRARTLTIDPVLEFATFYGGSSHGDIPLHVERDGLGNFYLMGQRVSPRLPEDGDNTQAVNGTSRMYYVAKLSADLESVFFTTYFDTPYIGVASVPAFSVAPDGSIYVSYSVRNWASALNPTTGPYGFAEGGGKNSNDKTVLLAISPDGTALRYRTVVGCEGRLPAQLIAAQDDGVTVAGNGYCTSFPISTGAYTNSPVMNGQLPQVLVARIASDGSSMPFSTVIGGAGSNEARDLRYDGAGRLWLTGSTTSVDFPKTANSYSYGTSPGTNAFLLRLSTDGSTLEKATVMGGPSSGTISQIRFGSDQSVYAYFDHADPQFPVPPNAFQVSTTVASGLFAKFDADLAGLLWATFYPRMWGLADFDVNDAGSLVAISSAGSSGEVPLGQAPMLRGPSPLEALHIGRLSADGSTLVDGTRFFLSTNMTGRAEILDYAGDKLTLLAGRFESQSTPPSTGTPLTIDQTSGSFGAYLARIDFGTPTACNFRLLPPTQNVDGATTTAAVQVDVAPGCPWIAERHYWSGPGYELSPANGIGPATLTASFPRSRISTGDSDFYIRVDDQIAKIIQGKASCDWQTVTPASIQFPAEGGLVNVDFDIPGNCEWFFSGVAPWLSTRMDSGQPVPPIRINSVQFRLESQPNSFEARSASIRIGNLTLPVTQDAGGCTATVTPMIVNVPASGGTYPITLATTGQNCGWQTVTSSRVAIQGDQSGSGSGTVTAAISPNPTNVPQVETLYLAGKTIEFRQAAGQCTATVSPTRFQFGPGYSSLGINIDAIGDACQWRPVVSAPWVELQLSGESPSGSGSLSASIRENPTGETRTATIQLLGKTVEITQFGTTTATVSFFVIQAGMPFTVNGLEYRGYTFLEMPLGTKFTVSVPATFRPSDGVLLVNRGWDSSGELTRTYTVGEQGLNLILNTETYVRVRLALAGNSAGDGSRVEVITSPDRRREETDGTYYRSGYEAIRIEAFDGSRSTFLRWEGSLSWYGTARVIHSSFASPIDATAVYSTSDVSMPIQFLPARAALSYGTQQQLLTAVVNFSATGGTAGVTMRLGLPRCDGMKAPFYADLNGSTTPATATLRLDIAAAALLPEGTYECVLPFAPLNSPQEERNVPVDLTIAIPSIPANGVRIWAAVEGAAFRRIPVPSGGIVSIFGERMAGTTLDATTIPLPHVLGDVRAEIRQWGEGTVTPLPLFYVSPLQLNVLIPSTHPLGLSEIRVMRTGLEAGSFPVMIYAKQPSLFTANSDGKGAPAGQFVRVNNSTGAQVTGDLYTCSNGAGTCLPRKLEFGSSNESLFLVLYGTGLPSQPAKPRVFVTGQELEVTYCGAQGHFVGLDQVNVKVPRSLAGVGLRPVLLVYEGAEANVVEVQF